MIIIIIIDYQINYISENFDLPIVYNRKHFQQFLQVCDEQTKELHAVYPKSYINSKHENQIIELDFTN
jgi:hypothetical protein